MWDAGTIPANSLYIYEGLQDWVEAKRFCENPKWAGSHAPSNTLLASVQRSANSGGGGVIAAGVVCALVSLLFLPPAFGLAAFVCGIVGVAKGNVGGGIVVIIMAVTCGLAGMYMGAMLMSR